MGEKRAGQKTQDHRGAAGEQETPAHRIEQRFAAVRASADLQQRAVGQHCRLEGEVPFGILRDANDADLAAVTFPPGRLVAECHPIFRRANQGHVVEHIHQPDEQRFLHFRRLGLHPVPQGANPAGLINGGGFLQARFEHFVVFAAHGRREQVIGEGEERQAARGENQRIPEA